jgi:hypothetical protein
LFIVEFQGNIILKLLLFILLISRKNLQNLIKIFFLLFHKINIFLNRRKKNFFENVLKVLWQRLSRLQELFSKVGGNGRLTEPGGEDDAVGAQFWVFGEVLKRYFK